jgi:hypothetical protein
MNESASNKIIKQKQNSYKMKKTIKKLTLGKSTIHNLTSFKMQQLIGGVTGSCLYICSDPAPLKTKK